MTPERWQKLQLLITHASALERAERERYLAAECAGDPDLHDEALRMLAAYSETGHFFEDAIGKAASHAAALTNYVIGDRIGAYRITALVGHGGMGIVYRGERSDGQFRQAVAIKVVRLDFGATDALLARFRQERQMLASVTHPHIARLIDGGVTPAGLPYLVMEYVEGTNLIEFAIARNLSTTARLQLLQQVCDAIQYAHQNLIVHRDLKPSNILVTEDGTCKLLDFGIAKLLVPSLSDSAHPDEIEVQTIASERLMTPEYASPEQARGDRITTATDIYGLGLLLYELLAGRRPFLFAGRSPLEAQQLITQAAPPPPSLVLADSPQLKTHRATDLDRIVLKALHKQPERRYASALELSLDINRYLQGFPVIARPDSLRYRATRFITRHKLAVGAAAIFLLTVIGLSISLAVQARRARQEAASADAVSQYLTGLFDSTQPDATQGRSTSARELLDTGTAHLDRDWKGDARAKARLLSTLGSVYYQLGALPEAASLLTQSKTIYTQTTGPSSPELADILNSLGEAELEGGDYEASLRDYSESVHIFERIRPESSELADAMDGLSGILWEIGDYPESERYHLLSVGMASRVLGPEAPMTLVDKSNLAVLYLDMGRYKDAEALNRQVLAARLKIFGEANSHTASSIDHLGILLARMNRFAEARSLLLKAFTLRQQLYGAIHHNVAGSMGHLAEYYTLTGDLAQAKSFAGQALVMTRKVRGDKSLETASAQDALGLILMQTGETARARSLIQEAFHTRQALPSEPLPLLAESYDHMGLLDLAEGKASSAQSNLEHALQLDTRLYAKTSPLLAVAYAHLGRAQLAGGLAGEAASAYRNALSIAQASFADAPNLLCAEALEGLGKAGIALNQPQAADSLAAGVRMRQAVLATVQGPAEASAATAPASPGQPTN